MTLPGTARAMGFVACRSCGLVSTLTDALRRGRCARCASTLHVRETASAQRTLAWLVAGMLLYVPANVLPVMHTNGVGGGADSTIFSGIVSFWRAGAWDIAVIIFIASVAVPATKVLSLGLLLWTVQRRSEWAKAHRTKLYRAVDIIGYWSMLDVVVVALTTALLQFKALGTAEPRPGIVFFCAVVVTTMVAAKSFDPRLIWDTRAADG